MTRRTSGLIACLIFAAAGLSFAQGAAPREGRCFEMRTYTATPGKLDALNARFRNHTLKLFEKHGMQVVGFWTPTDTGSSDVLVYILAHKNRAAADTSWKAFREDPEWIAVKAASEKDGSILAKIESVFLAPTDYSPIK